MSERRQVSRRNTWVLERLEVEVKHREEILTAAGCYDPCDRTRNIAD